MAFLRHDENRVVPATDACWKNAACIIFLAAFYAISFDEVFEDAFASRVRVTARGQSDERIRRRNRYIKKSYGKYEIPFLPLPLLYDYT